MTDTSSLFAALDSTRERREELYREFHRHPELSMQEERTAGVIRHELASYGYEVIELGATGTVGVLRNGDGPTFAARADIDALPVPEATGLDYASRDEATSERTGETSPVMHACGHDVHIIALLGAAQAMAENTDAWSGTYEVIFQPGEEIFAGAKSLVDHGICDAIDRPEVIVGQHVLGGKAGTIGTRPGPVMSSAASVEIVVHGRGSHGSMPQLSIDPVVIAASIIVRLQSIVAREIAPDQVAVLTVGKVHAGSQANIIPDTATLLANLRAFDDGVMDQLRDGVERIVRAECEAAGCEEEPEIRFFDTAPLTENDPDVTAKLREAFEAEFGDDVVDLPLVSASEDFSIVPNAFDVPYCYWGLGGFEDPDLAPGNHNPTFAPAMQPTLDRGAQAMIVAALTWLG